MAGRVERLSIKLSEYRYQIVNVTGEKTFQGDLLSRWNATDLIRQIPKEHPNSVRSRLQYSRTGFYGLIPKNMSF